MTTWALEIPFKYHIKAITVREESPDLIKKAKNGDPIAFQEIVERYSTRIHTIAYQIVGNSEDAMDITQNVCLRLNSSLGTFNLKFPLDKWLYRLTVNLSIDYLRKETRHRNVSLDEVNDETVFTDSQPQPDLCAERNELIETINQILGYLTPNQRKVFVLRDLQGFSSKDVAQILKCSPITVRIHLSKSRKKIKEVIEIYYPDLIPWTHSKGESN